MASRRIKKLLTLTLGGVVALAAACSAADGQAPTGTNGNGQTPGPTGSCGNGDCSACATCFEACMCATNGDPACVNNCGGPGAGGSGPGAGGSGVGAAGGSGGAAGFGGTGVGGSGGTGVGGSGGTGVGGTGVGGTGVGGTGAGGTTGGSGGTSACGDFFCDVFTEDCNTCPLDCICGTGGSGGSAGVSGAGGSGAGGSGGTGSGYTPEQQGAIDRALSGIGFSYWWGHGRFMPGGPTPGSEGSCDGGCPSCTHSGAYGGDCSGFAAKVWVVPSSNSDMTDDSHPYSTADFYEDTSQWTTVDQSAMNPADAMVYRSGGAGHIFIYEYGDSWGSMYAHECKGCSYGCTSGFRTASSSYHPIRRTGY